MTEAVARASKSENQKNLVEGTTPALCQKTGARPPGLPLDYNQTTCVFGSATPGLQVYVSSTDSAHLGAYPLLAAQILL